MLLPATREKILAEVRRFPRRRTALLPSLKHAQVQVGWLPPEAIAEVADLVGVSHASANELATFYSMLLTRPGGRQRIEVCVQLPCALRGAEGLLKRLAEGFGIAPGEITPDGNVELVRVAECFGACHRAPMCRVNDEYHENLTPGSTQRFVEEIKGRAASQAAAGAASTRGAA
jgi:NADH-quinone oxidoreductase subunit E